MPKNKSKSAMKKYVKVLDKFGFLPPFEFTKKEKKIVKYLADHGATAPQDLDDVLDFKPGKAEKLVERLIQKGALEADPSGMVSLTLTATNYLHSKKTIKKSAKKFCKFVEAMNEKELDEFMSLVSSFKVAPEFPPIEDASVSSGEVAMKEEKPLAPAEEPVSEEVPIEQPAKPKAPRRRKRKAAPKKEIKALAQEPAQEEPSIEEPALEEPKEEE